MNFAKIQSKISTKTIIMIPVVIAIIAILVLIVKAVFPARQFVTGMVEVTEIDVASKIPGRIDSLYVKEGTHVQKGQLLATLESKEMDAKLEQGRGMMDAARSKYDMALNGARPQERQAVQDQYLQAKHQYELAEKTWNRISSLYKDSVVSLQEKDQVEFQYKAAKEQMSAAAAKYDMVVKGTRSEEIRGAQSLFHQAENGYKEALAYYQELRITSPIDGEVSKKVSEAGEVVASGYPIFTVLDPNDAYVVVQIREDLMPMIKMGATFSGVIPAIGKGEHQFAVDYIAPMGDYATWKPTNQKSDFDLKTFEVHLRCKEHIDGFRPGMTVDLYY